VTLVRDWEVMKQEAVILCELLRTLKPGREAEAVIERAQSLQTLAFEALQLRASTEGGPRH
jgi:hypothetical protein